MTALMDPLEAQLAFDLGAALEDVDDQRELDHRRDYGRPPSRGMILARMKAVVVALEHSDEPFALRQAFIDLSAVSTDAAAWLERPTIPSRRERP